MKPRDEINVNQSCSCTSCLYETDSARISLKRVKAGSRIDKLNIAKHLPLRERKLLDKLVRTRAVYDDVRNQLLSESSTIISNKANFKSKKYLPLLNTDTEYDYTEKSSDISELVDLVDKGVVLVDKGLTLGPKKISDCCSCCSCNLHDYKLKGFKRRHAGGNTTLKSSAILRQRIAHDIRVRKHLQHAKHIRSDPCTCTLQFSDLSNRNSKSTPKNVRHNQPYPVLESWPFEDSKRSKTIKQSGMGEADRKSLTKCACIVKDKIKSRAQKSLTKLKQRVATSALKPIQDNMKQQFEFDNVLVKEPALGELTRRSLVKCACKIKDNIELAARKSLEKVKEKAEASINTLRIHKDSLTLYRKQLERKRQLQDWECDFECFPEVCVPEKCYRIKKRRTARKSIATGYGIEKIQRKMKETETSSASDANIQASIVNKTINTSTKKQKIVTHGNGNNLAKSHIHLEIWSKNKGSQKQIGPKKNISKTGPSKKRKTKQIMCMCEKTGHPNTALKTRSTSSARSYPSKTSPLALPATNTAKSSRSSIRIVKPLSKGNSASDSFKTSRQTARISSSYSFNIEFHKDKPIKKSQIRQKVPSKNTITIGVRKAYHRHKTSGTSQKREVKNTRADKYALKRCFCTLKLKAKKTKTKINKSFQKESKASKVIKGKSMNVSTESWKVPSLAKINQLTRMPSLLPYECEPMVCIPGKCNLQECLQIIKKHGLKYHSIQTNTDYQTESTPSITTKSVSDYNYYKKQGSENTTLNKLEKSQPHPPPIFPLNGSDKTQKQVVRLGSSVSFDIEFAKERSTNDQRKPDILVVKPKEKKIDNVKFISFKPSHVSNSTVKSRYSSTKHTLRRCLCTLGLGKHGKIKKKVTTSSKGTLTDRQIITQIRHVNPSVTCNCNKAVETEEKKNIRKRFKHKLMSYECEPGICVPGECNPYECKENITKREGKRSRGPTKQSSTEHRRSKSTSSFTTTTLTPYKVKKVQSTLPTFKSMVPGKKKVKVSRETRLTSSSADRQVVRIGSNFSFSIDFFKDTSLPPIHVKNVQHKNKTRFKDRGVQDKGSRHKSKNNVKCGCTQVQKKNLSVSIGPTIKRCFCILKLQKSGKNEISNVVNTGTETIFSKEEMYPKFEKATKGTKTNKKINNFDKLEPFECEPYICAPGKCDPYQCAEIIKGRDVTRQLYEFGASTDRVKKKISITNKSARKAKSVQSNTKHQKTHRKKGRRTKYSVLNPNPENPSRQAVKISSNFSFNVEFFKDRNSKEKMSKEIYDIETKNDKNYLGKSFKTSVNQRKSQSEKIKKNNKASGAEHVLKRCFCTLKLQNKLNTAIKQDQQNKTYTRSLKTTVMPIQVSTKRMNLHSLVNSKISSHIPVVLKKSNVNNNNMTYYYNREENNIHYRKEIPIASSECTESLTTKINKKQSQLTGLSPYLKSSFCTMNIHVVKGDKNSHKLKSYECEAGICIPGQCDPYICQNLIMKRLMKRASKMTGTKITSKSISIGTTKSQPKKHRDVKTISRDDEVSHSGLKYKLHKAHKRAVRVGSNFSFNIEFSKDSLPSATTSDSYKTKSEKSVNKKLKNQGTKGFETNSSHNKTSQSDITTQHHRASSMTPTMQRCFCTLKLQKKGRQQIAMNSQVDKRKASPPKKKNKPKVRTTETGQNTMTPQKHLFNLSPYECERLVCVPGECDPYKCLELMNKRNKNCQAREFGTDSIRSRNISASNLTTQQNKQIQVKHIEMKPRYSSKPINENDKQPSRQAVRIGSSCSFNIEFYKDRSSSGHQYEVSNDQNNFRDHFSNSYKSNCHRDSQVETWAKRVKSNKTSSFIKRCFCTAKLRGADKLIKADAKETQSQNASSSFLKKCFCKLKSITAVKETTNKTVNTETETFVRTNRFIRHQITRNAGDYRPQILKPYECEPGICVPGECNPYRCAKIIRSRKAKLLTKTSMTDTPVTRSMSTNHKSSIVSKGVITYSKEKKSHAKRNINQPFDGNSVKKQRKLQSLPSERNVVRIGSNFSFDIEFYKNKTPHFKLAQKTPNPIKDTSKAGKSYDKGFTGNDILLRNRKSQVKSAKKQNRASVVGPILKRCFCTLKLHNQSNAVSSDLKKYTKKKELDASQITSKSTETSDFKALPNVYSENVKNYSLKPYECEPNICVPGECNPYECAKLIQKRLRQSATSTPQRKMKSIKSTTKSKRKSTDTTQQFSLKHKKHLNTNNANGERLTSLIQKPGKTMKLSIDRSSRQAVKIGSNFNFDIEFFKNKAPVLRQKIKKHRNKKPQSSNVVQHLDSQILTQKVGFETTQVTPFLKRCLCTLKLHKSDNKPIEKQNVATITNEKLKDQIHWNVDYNLNRNKKYQVLDSHRNFDPYECEPGVCVPGKCDPYKCEERIKQRRKEIQSKLSGTDGSKDQSTSSFIPSPRSFKYVNTQNNLYSLHRNHLKTRRHDVKKYQDLKFTKDSHRQAVRVGSSFSFDIEFYKDKTQKHSYMKKKPNKQEWKLKGETTDRKVSLRNRSSQIGITTASKASGFGPLLKRCFCTLKLQKVGKLQQPPIVKSDPKQKFKDLSASAKTKDKRRKIIMRSISSKTKMHDLQLYKRAPNVCISDECDLLECEKRIKRSKFKELCSGTKSQTKKTKKIQSHSNCKCKKVQPAKNLSIDKAKKIVRRFYHDLHANGMAKPVNRQAVHIGSNLRFNVEFHKERSPNYNQTINDKKRALKGKSKAIVTNLKTRCRSSRCTEISRYSRKLQVANMMKDSRDSGRGPLLKRCFCTLALQKKVKKDNTNLTSVKAEPSKVSTQNKTTVTKAQPFPRKLNPYECEPGKCIPGKCNPYDCQELIKKRKVKSKSKKLSTQRYRQISVANMATECRCKSVSTSKPKQMKYNDIDKRVHESRVVEQPRFVFDRISNRKQAVKIGSNLSFNIEFYKEKTPKKEFNAGEYGDEKSNHYSKIERITDLRLKPDSTKMTNTNICKLKNCEMQAHGFKTENKASAVGNTLKRCFCTSRLHKINLPNSKTQRPNLLLVGRVDQIKIKSPFKPSKSCDKCRFDQMKPIKSALKNKQSAPCSFDCTSSQKDTKTASTKINKKYLTSEPLDANRIKNHETKKNIDNKRKNESGDMKTILPYTPSKFNKNRSKTILLQTKKEINFNKKCSCCKDYLDQEKNTDKNDRNIPKSKNNDKGKVKFSKAMTKTIKIKETNEMPNLGPPTPKRFLWRCIQIFRKRNKKPQSDVDKCPFEPPNCQTQLQIKSQKDILKISKSERRPKTTKTTEPKKSKSLKMARLSEKDELTKKSNQVEQKKKFSRFQGGDAGQKEMKPVMNKINNPTSVLEEKKCICLSCQARKCQRQNKLVKFTVSPTAKGDLENTTRSKQGKPLRLAQQNKVNFRFLGKRFSTTDKQDQKYADTPDKNNTFRSKLFRGKESVETKKESIQKGAQGDKELPRQKNKTGVSYKFVQNRYPCAETTKTSYCCNKKEDRNSPKKACLCRSPDNKYLCVSPHHKNLWSQALKKKCPCGSPVCKEEFKITHVNHTKKPKKPCVCGSFTCAREAAAEHSCMCNCRCGKIMTKRKRKKDLNDHKEYHKRVKKYNREDRARRRQRLKANKEMYKIARKYRKTTDINLAAQSVLDIAKLGCSSLIDVGRSAHRAITDRKHTVECLKMTAKDPKRGWKAVKTAVSDSNVGATCKRVKLRLGAMRCSKKVKSKLEDYAVTNYMLHMLEKDPKKRLKRKPKKREREQTDFGCSLFMSTLRKRPFLSVYNMCPWFYPHCLSMLNIWRQFTDIMLFLLAVVVWSPCILCMEGCRALMCCFLCTG